MNNQDAKQLKVMKSQGCEKHTSERQKPKTHNRYQQEPKSSSNSGHRNSKGTNTKSSDDYQKEGKINNHKNVKSLGGVSKSLRTNVSNTENVDLSSPGLCTVLQLANEIQAASAEIQSVRNKKLPQENDVKEVFKQNAIKKANIPFTKKIFKNLVDLHINDEDIISGKSVYLKNTNFGKNRDRFFDLSHYYKPDFSSECCVSIQDQKVEVEKIQYYKGFEIYERIESLPNLT